jgi:hypothetical protein
LSFVGRAEFRVKHILQCLFKDKAKVFTQVHIQNLIKKEEFEILGKEHNQHKFDLVVSFNCGSGHLIRPDIIVEVNYKHKAGAGRKWHNVYKPAIVNAGKIPVTIDDFESTSLFDTDRPRALRWSDYIDVINALETAGVEP